MIDRGQGPETADTLAVLAWLRSLLDMTLAEYNRDAGSDNDERSPPAS